MCIMCSRFHSLLLSTRPRCHRYQPDKCMQMLRSEHQLCCDITHCDDYKVYIKWEERVWPMQPPNLSQHWSWQIRLCPGLILTLPRPDLNTHVMPPGYLICLQAYTCTRCSSDEPCKQRCQIALTAPELAWHVYTIHETRKDHRSSRARARVNSSDLRSFKAPWLYERTS